MAKVCNGNRDIKLHYRQYNVLWHHWDVAVTWQVQYCWTMETVYHIITDSHSTEGTRQLTWGTKKNASIQARRVPHALYWQSPWWCTRDLCTSKFNFVACKCLQYYHDCGTILWPQRDVIRGTIVLILVLFHSNTTALVHSLSRLLQLSPRLPEGISKCDPLSENPLFLQNSDLP